jgi:hypothetical protein
MGSSTRATGLLLAAAAAATSQQASPPSAFIAKHARTVLITLGLTAAPAPALLGTLRPGALFTRSCSPVHRRGGGRPHARRQRLRACSPRPMTASRSAHVRAAMTQLGYFAGAALGGAALAAGGYSALTHVLGRGSSCSPCFRTSRSSSTPAKRRPARVTA